MASTPGSSKDPMMGDNLGARTESSATDKARDMGAAMKDKASEMASQMGQSARSMGHKLGETADTTFSSVGSGMKNLACSLREAAPQSGMLGSATHRMAETLDSTGRYLEKHGLSGMGEDLTTVVRRNPIPSLLVAMGLGFLLARASRS